MKSIALFSCLSLALGTPPVSNLPSGRTLEPERSLVEEGVKPMQHEKSPLSDDPPIRLEKLFTLQAKESRGSSGIAFSPDGKILAVAWLGGYVQYKNADVALWNVGTRKLLHVLPHIEEPIAALAFVPPGDRLATGCMNLNKVFLWDARNGRLLETLDIGGRAGHDVTGLAAFPDGKRVIVCATTGLLVWDLQAKTHATLPLHEHVPLAPGEKRAIARYCAAVGSTADGSRFATSARDVRFAARILLWDGKTCRVTGTIPIGHLGYHFAYAPDGGSLAAEYYDANAKGLSVGVWDAATGKKRLSGAIFGEVSALVYTRDGKHLLVAGKHMPMGTPTDNAVIGVWDVVSGRLVNRMNTSSLSVRLAVSPDNRLLAVAGRNIDVYAIEYAAPSNASPDAPFPRKP